jgi:hypothetical protein
LSLAGQLAQIDWQAPWFAPYAEQGQRLAEAVLAECSAALSALCARPDAARALSSALPDVAVAMPGAVARALNRHFDSSPIFLPAGRLRAVAQSTAQGQLPQRPGSDSLHAGSPEPVAAHPAAQEAYESRIARTACLPVRDDLHDFFNGLVWLHRPQLKARLNALQAAEIAQRGIGAVRGPVRDALTRFDESGGLWQGPPDLLAAWRERRWADFLWHSRSRWPGEVRFEVFGHALLAQLATAPRPGLTAHGLNDLPLAWSASEWAAPPFLPLPVAGVPGWWPGQGIGFYDDASVFRPLPASVARG